MTRKHFELIARVLFDTQPFAEDMTREAFNAADSQWERTLDEFSRMLPSTNGNFQRDKFERYARTGKY